MEDCDQNHRENHRSATDQRQDGKNLFFLERSCNWSFNLQIIFKNLTDNAKNIAANAKIEDMGRLFKTHITSKQDVKSTLTSVIEVSLEPYSILKFTNFPFLFSAREEPFV